MPYLRTLDAYIIIKPKSYYDLSGRLTTKTPSLDANEVAVKINIQVPDAIFKRPQLQAKIVIPESSVTPSTLDAAVIDNVREILEQQTGFDVRVSMVDPIATED